MKASVRAYALVFAAVMLPAVACGTPETMEDSRGQSISVSPSPTAVLVPPEGQEATASPTLTPTEVTATVVPSSSPANPTPAIAEDAACDGRISGSLVGFATIDEMVWFSHQVVVGTVVERQPPKKVTISGSVLPFVIVTDVQVDVEKRFRGEPTNPLWIRTLGGSIGDCSQEFPDSPQLAMGERVLLFAREVVGADTQVYEILGSSQGRWEISESGVVTTEAVHLLPDGTPLSLEAVEAIIVASLADGPPIDSPLLDTFLVPVDEAPLAPGIDATGTVTGAP
jgi:hypothetical protein